MRCFLLLTCSDVPPLAHKVPVVAAVLVVHLQVVHLDAVLVAPVVVRLTRLPVTAQFRRQQSAGPPLVPALLSGVRQADPELVPLPRLQLDPRGEL